MANDFLNFYVHRTYTIRYTHRYQNRTYYKISYRFHVYFRLLYIYIGTIPIGPLYISCLHRFEFYWSSSRYFSALCTKKTRAEPDNRHFNFFSLFLFSVYTCTKTYKVMFDRPFLAEKRKRTFFLTFAESLLFELELNIRRGSSKRWLLSLSLMNFWFNLLE